MTTSRAARCASSSRWRPLSPDRDEKGLHGEHDALAVDQLWLRVDGVVDASIESHAFDEVSSHKVSRLAACQ